MFGKIIYYYSNLKGEANRTEFGVYLFLDIIANFAALYFSKKIDFKNDQIINLFYTWIILNFIFIPINAVSTRRLKHIGANTGIIFLNFIPIINIFFRIYLLIKKGK
jgi:uncharacterized membrane protein YhaH (DUF805 family)